MIYFASDFHLGIDVRHTSLERERLIVQWLESIKHDAEEIYLVGDIFDFWFEYKKVIPKGFTRLIGKLAELRDLNIPIYFFTGNHDMWMFDYFEKEMGIPIYRKPIQRKLKGKDFFIGHGDGLGPGDHGYKFIKKIFANRLCQILFSWLPSSVGIGIAQFWSGKSRSSNKDDQRWFGAKDEWLAVYCEEKSKELSVDYFVFGHRHLPIDYTLENKTSRYINLGEWMNHYSYAQFDGKDLEIKFFNNPDGRIYPLGAESSS